MVLGSRGADAERVVAALARIERAHAVVDHPCIARPIERGEEGGVAFLELAADAVVDGSEVLRLLADSGQKLSYNHGDTIFTTLRETLEVAHRATAATTGGPLCLGQLSFGNFLFSRDGRMWIVGLGHNFPIFTETDRLEGLTPVWQAWEVHAGQPPTPSSDYVAVLLGARSLATFCELAEITQRVLQAATSPRNVELYETVRWFETSFIHLPPDRRPSIGEGIAKSQRLREILGMRIDRDGMRARIAQLLAHAEGETESNPSEHETVTVASDGRWLAVGNGARAKLGRANGLLIRALVAEHQERPGHALSVWELLDAGWPDDDPIPEAGANRVYVAIARLRQLGLRHSIERDADGYRIRPGAPIRVASGAV